MRKVTLGVASLLIALFAMSAMAQTEASKWKIGTGTNLSFFSGKPTMKRSGGGSSKTHKADVSSTTLRLGLDLGYFVIDNLAVGASGEYLHLALEGNGISLWSIAPKASYYFNVSESFKPFVSAEVGYASLTMLGKEEEVSHTEHIGGGLHYAASAGIAYFFTPQVGLSFELGYNSNTFGRTEEASQLGGEKAEKVRIATTLGGVATTLGFTICF